MYEGAVTCEQRAVRRYRNARPPICRLRRDTSGSAEQRLHRIGFDALPWATASGSDASTQQGSQGRASGALCSALCMLCTAGCAVCRRNQKRGYDVFLLSADICTDGDPCASAYTEKRVASRCTQKADARHRAHLPLVGQRLGDLASAPRGSWGGSGGRRRAVTAPFLARCALVPWCFPTVQRASDRAEHASTDCLLGSWITRHPALRSPARYRAAVRTSSADENALLIS